MKNESFNKITVLSLALFISTIFIIMIYGFLKTVFLAAIFAGLLYPLYCKILKKTSNKTSLSAMLTLVFLIIVVLIPISLISIIIIEQAGNFTQTSGPAIEKFSQAPHEFIKYIESNTYVSKIFPDKQKMIETLNNLLSNLGNFFVNELSVITSGAANFLFLLFIFLISLYYFLIYGEGYLKTILYYVPLKNEEEDMLMSRFTKVAKATLKGTFIVGVIQGTTGGVIMALLGVPNAVFLGMLMIIASIIPALGSGLVWFPAAIYLLISGHYIQGIVLIIVGATIIGNIDNVLRPKLVGKDAEMPDIMILLATLGGLSLFGLSGIIIGPIIGSIFLSIWDIYGNVFKNYLYPKD